MSVEKLKLELGEVNKKRNELIEEIRKTEDVELLPALREQYEGKYFSYRNSYSCPEKESDYWNIYYFVQEIKNKHYAKVTRFETDKFGGMRISSEETSIQMLETEISQQEFHKAFEKFLQVVGDLRASAYK